MIQLLLGVLKMGFLVNFLSKPVISGFTSAAALIIGFSQLKHLLGTNLERSNEEYGLVQHITYLFDQINWYTLGIGVIAIMILKILKKVNRKIPAALIVVTLGIALVYLLKLDNLGVKIVEDIPDGLPNFGIPTMDYSRLGDLLPMALTLSLIAFMEAISVAKAIEVNHKEYEIDPNQELVALGTANIIGSLFQSYPTTGGLSRTAVNDQSGAKTGVAA